MFQLYIDCYVIDISSIVLFLLLLLLLLFYYYSQTATVGGDHVRSLDAQANEKKREGIFFELFSH